MARGQPASKAAHLSAGSDAEDRALEFLQHRGLALVTRNHRCAAGEIDLVMQDAELLVFVEVRYRKHSNYGGAAASVTATKRISRTAMHFLTSRNIDPDIPCRFDVIAVDGATAPPSWICDAFEAEFLGLPYAQ